MRVKIEKGVATITMTNEQLRVLRNTLNEGAGRKKYIARQMRTMRKGASRNALRTVAMAGVEARRACAVNNSLEAATQKWVREKS